MWHHSKKWESLEQNFSDSEISILSELFEAEIGNEQYLGQTNEYKSEKSSYREKWTLKNRKKQKQKPLFPICQSYLFWKVFNIAVQQKVQLVVSSICQVQGEFILKIQQFSKQYLFRWMEGLLGRFCHHSKRKIGERLILQKREKGS